MAAFASGSDADGDGIDDGVAPNSYEDPDGVVSTTSPDLANETGDLTEVGFRETPVPPDKDWDGIPDDQDRDADGDGILDIDEAEFVSVDRLGTPTGINGADRNNVQTGDVFIFPGVFGGNDIRVEFTNVTLNGGCLLYTSPSPRDRQKSRMPSSA